jgi:hypothetical protein
MHLFEIIPALVFVLSSGLLFNKRFRENNFLVAIAGMIALVATYFLFEEVTNRIVKSHIEKQRDTPKPTPPDLHLRRLYLSLHRERPHPSLPCRLLIKFLHPSNRPFVPHILKIRRVLPLHVYFRRPIKPVSGETDSSGFNTPNKR